MPMTTLQELPVGAGCEQFGEGGGQEAGWIGNGAGGHRFLGQLHTLLYYPPILARTSH